MILIALGSNLTGPWGTPQETIARAIQELQCWPTRVTKASTSIVTAPFGRKNQPDFVNAVVQIKTHLPPHALLSRLHAIERLAGRKRGLRWGPRTLDLDIIDYHGLRLRSSRHGITGLTLPHAGIADRSFVLLPITEIAPAWRHPVNRMTARQMFGQA